LGQSIGIDKNNTFQLKQIQMGLKSSIIRAET